MFSTILIINTNYGPKEQSQFDIWRGKAFLLRYIKTEFLHFIQTHYCLSRPCEIWGRQIGNRTGFPPSTSVSFFRKIVPVLHTHLYLHAASIRRTSGRSLKAFKKAMFFQKSEAFEGKLFSSWYSPERNPEIPHGLNVVNLLKNQPKFKSLYD